VPLPLRDALSVPPAPAPRAPRLLGLERAASLRARLVARDERALVELIDVATPWLLGVTQSLLHDADEAEEAVLHSFRQAWTHAERIPAEEGALVPWLLRIARNRALDLLRSSRRRALRHERALHVGALDDGGAGARLPDESALPGWHVHEAVHAALRDLPDDQRSAVELAYFGGLTHSEIAARLAVPLGTVKSRLNRAYERLRGTLAHLREWV
jgi:RNA polymerase sigma-70 factor (ECF subfamily)